MPAADVAALFDRNRLRVARELRGLTQIQLAREVGGVKAAALSQFETGHTRPTAPTLKRLAVALQVPLEFFAASGGHPREGDTPGFFRSLRSTAPRDRQQARALVELARELALHLESIVVLPELDLPRFKTVESTAREQIEEHAGEVRRRWGLPPGPVDDVVLTLERHGILTTRFRVNIEKVDAFSVPFSDRPVVVLGADKGLRDRSRFDASHELAHLVMHSAEQAGGKIIESQAQQFAAAFLMPEKDIREELPSRADWRVLVQLKSKWQVSISSLLMRAKTLDVLDEQRYVQAMKMMSMRGWRKVEPGDLGPAEIPQLLRRAIAVAADSGVSTQDLIRRAGLPEADVRKIMGETDDNRPRVQF